MLKQVPEEPSKIGISEEGAKRPLSINQWFLLIISFFLVGLGQPAWIWWMGLISAVCGWALFLKVLIDISATKRRFWIATCWYMLVEAVQISWMLTHPYSYVYVVFPLFSFLLGLQCGIFSLFVTREHISKLTTAIALAAIWTLLEWSRLYFFSGYSWNPIGLALSGALAPLQIASLFGVFGMTFWVMFVNLCALRAWLMWPKLRPAVVFIGLALFPYVYGAFHLNVHSARMIADNENTQPIRALLVQTGFPAEEAMVFESRGAYIAFVMDEWQQILNILKDRNQGGIDLIALPEYVVPFGTYTCIYPYEDVKAAFKKSFGEKSLSMLPAASPPFAKQQRTIQGDVWFVNNAFWAQGIANIFNTELITGLEDAEECENGICYYSAALHFKPHANLQGEIPERYSKRVLLPMAEYIPFASMSICKDLAAQYGISGSFTPGTHAKVLQSSVCPFSVSICYEETFGNLMCEGRQAGSELLVNLTSDVWYPNSRLPQQHATHARLRTVESGIPMLRACNTGVTSGFDSLGRQVAVLGEDHENPEWLADALYVEVPRYHYFTLYAHTGNSVVVAFCLVTTGLFCIKVRRKKTRTRL